MTYEDATTEVIEQLQYFIKDGWEIEDIIKWLDHDDVGNEYPNEWIHERADSWVDVYNSDLLDWLSENYANATLVENAIEEFGWPGDFFKALMQGQYLDNSELLNEAMADVLDDVRELETTKELKSYLEVNND